MVNTWYVNDAEFILQCFFEIMQPRVRDVVTIAVAKYFQERLMINNSDQIGAPMGKGVGLIQCIYNCKFFTHH